MNQNSAKTVELFCRELGGEGNPPLVVLHGMLGSSRNWLTTGGDLARAGADGKGVAHVFALDLRNHGKSPHADDMSYDVLVADVLAWLDARGLGRVTLMGHSFGGKIAMTLACRHPERVERLIVVDMAPRTYLSIAHRNEFAAMNELDLRTLSSRAEAELRFEARVSDFGMRKFLATNLERVDAGANGGNVADGGAGGRWRWTINLPAITAALPALEADPLGADERFDGETLFVTGGKSNYVRAEDHAAITRHFPGARIEVIANSGHNPHMETRAEFVRVVAAALMRGA